MDKKLKFLISWNAGTGSFRLVEAKALAGVLAFCVFFDVQAISIFGNSRQLIDHINGVFHIRIPLMTDWLDKIMFLRELSSDCSIQLIGHE